jgi:diguanylate cyclase (GGDEF)-like protein
MVQNSGIRPRELPLMAFSIRNLKIRNQILLMTLPPLVVLFCAVGLVFFAYRSVVNTNREAQQSKERVARLQSFYGHVVHAFNSVQQYVVAHQGNALVPYENAVTDGLADLNALDELESPDPGKLQEVARMRMDFEAFRISWAQPTIATARAGGNYNATLAMADGQQRRNAIGSEMSKLRREEEAGNTSQMLGAETMMWQMLVVGASLFVLLGGALVFLNGAWTRLIVAPVQQLIRAAEQVGRGDFAPTLPPTADNEFGTLSRSFSRMTNALRREREEMAALNRFSEAVTQCTAEPEVYDLLLHALKERFQPGQIIIFKMQTPENFLEAVATLAPLPKEAGAQPVVEDPHNCKAVRSGRSFVVNDVRVQALCTSKFALPSEGSYFCGPLIAGGIIIGSARMEAAPDIWTSDRQRLVESYLSGAATALSNLRMRDTMKAQANFDMLTGLYNRRFAEEYARKQFAIAKRSGKPLGVAMLDLDHFKELNDAHGHEIGDSVLRCFAKTVTESIRETNLVARYGGEEFLVVLPETSPKSCVLVAERIREAVMTMRVPSNTERPIAGVTVSIGVAAFPEHGGTLEEVMQASDKALYESKRRGRNRVTVAQALDSAAA